MSSPAAHKLELPNINLPIRSKSTIPERTRHAKRRFKAVSRVVSATPSNFHRSPIASSSPLPSFQKPVYPPKLVSIVQNNLERMSPERKPLVVVSTGAFSPIHLQHVRMFELSKMYLERRTEFEVVLGIISPSHDKYCFGKLRRTAAMAIPAKHRIKICETIIQETRHPDRPEWLAVDTWEVTRRGYMDHPSVLKHVKKMLREVCPLTNVNVMYLCGAAHLLKAVPTVMRQFGAVCVTRAGGATDTLEKEIRADKKRMAYIVEDNEMVMKDIAEASGTRIRNYIKDSKRIDAMTGPSVVQYMRSQRIFEKMRKQLPWTIEDKTLPESMLSSSPAISPKKTLS
eukprot:TRINITY_DN10404_c0_g3_i1.p1 TRINITY_DN10404_c0_g3~~TRINITY_DN10404_c0_g3_i1.p1  ORF type:complete len:342 (-),score=67.31 TRINITY_DN10404_c0_g3_i1:149-1174(-)